MIIIIIFIFCILFHLQIFFYALKKYIYGIIGATVIWFIIHTFFLYITKKFLTKICRNIAFDMIKKKNKIIIPSNDPKKYEQKAIQMARKQLCTNLTAFLHAIYASSISIKYIIENKNTLYKAFTPEYNHVYDPNIIIYLIGTCGYFVYDLILACWEFDIPYIIHGGFCTIFYSYTLTPYFLQVSCIYLIYEFSTIFIHLRWFSYYMSWTYIFYISEVCILYIH